MTRVAYVGAVPPLPGGIAQHGAQVVGALRDADLDVTVVSWRSQYPAVLHPTEHRRVRDGRPVPGATYELRWWDPAGWVTAGRRLRGHDLLVVPWITPLQAPALRAIAHAADLPVVAIVHNPMPHEPQPFVRQLTRWFFRDVSGVVAHASACVETLRSMVPDLPAAVVAHPPNLTVEPTPLPPTDPLRLLFFGFVRPYKGVDVLLEALWRLRLAGRDDIRLTIAGEVWGDRETLRAQIREAGVGDIVDARLGYVDDDEVARLLAAHHVVVAPYRSATQSGVVPLACAAARPTVATTVGGLAEQVIDGRTGVLARPGDPASLAHAILQAESALPAMAAAAYWHTPRWADVARGLLAVGGLEHAIPPLPVRVRQAV